MPMLSGSAFVIAPEAAVALLVRRAGLGAFALLIRFVTHVFGGVVLVEATFFYSSLLGARALFLVIFTFVLLPYFSGAF